MIRIPTRALAFSLSLVLTLTLNPAAARAGEPPLKESAGEAVEEVLPALQPAETQTHQSPSGIDPGQQIKVESAAFRGNGTALNAVRVVGAVAPVENGTPTSRTASVERVRRPKAGVRSVVIEDTSNQWGPGMLIARWTERDGVNYILAWKDRSRDRKALIRLIKAFPADGTKPSRQALRAIKKAPPVRAGSERSVGLQFVDGSGEAVGDLDDEGTLCNGCAATHSNYTFFWQRILSADGTPPSGGADCWFGTNTTNATKAWQKKKGLSPQDGIVGPSSRGKANVDLATVSPGSADGSDMFFTGDSWTLWFWRNGSNDGSNNWKFMLNGRYVAYNYATLC